MRNHPGFAVLTTLAGGLLAAAFLPMAVAFADEYDLTPDLTTFAPTQVEGYPPLFEEVTGTEAWHITDLTTNNVVSSSTLGGVDTETTFGSFTNDDFLTTNAIGILEAGPNPITFDVPIGSDLDVANFGLGFSNAWMDLPSGPEAGVSDLLITPFGDLELVGNGFADLATVLNSVLTG